MPTTFLSLPREVRDEISSLCLVHQRNPGAEIIPHPISDEDVEGLFGRSWPSERDYADEDMSSSSSGQTLGNTRYSRHLPCVALLAVNRQTRAEAMLILTGQNTFRFRIAADDDKTATDHPFWQAHLPYAKHLTFYFRYTDTSAARIAAMLLEPRWRDIGIGGFAHGEARYHSRLSRWDLWFSRFRQLSRCSGALSSISVNIQTIIPPSQPDLPDTTRLDALTVLGQYLWRFMTTTWGVSTITLADSTFYPKKRSTGEAARNEYRLTCGGDGEKKRDVEIIARCQCDFNRLSARWDGCRDFAAEDRAREEKKKEKRFKTDYNDIRW